MRFLFISDDDRCRGPMARAIAERLARREDLDIENAFDSAGLAAQGGEPALPEASAFMRQEKYTLRNHRSKPLSPPLADGADVILCMTADLTARTREAVGPDYEEKVLLLNEGVMLATTRMDIEHPASNTQGSFRRLYASLLASMGRLVRTLEEPSVCPEYFGAKTLPKKLKPGQEGPRASAATLDPEKRLFLSNLVFHLIEFSFDPPTTTALQEALEQRGHQLSRLEVEEILRQDLHGSVRLDKEGVWHVIPGAAQRRQEKARQEAKHRAAEEARQRQEKQRQADEEKMSEPLALEILGLSRETPSDAARQKYRALLKRYHPDKFHDDEEFRQMAEAKAQRINRAWEAVKERWE